MSVAYKKILVPLDGSTLAAQALPHALALVELHQAEIILFRVVHETHFVEEFVTEGKLQVDQRQERAINEATAALTELADDLKLRQFKVTPVVEV
ncbi:MAG: universal stress protein, partial [Anaerolineales bacterium]|nr:universal stress protein [Anaerolineales bacterium]